MKHSNPPHSNPSFPPELANLTLSELASKVRTSAFDVKEIEDQCDALGQKVIDARKAIKIARRKEYWAEETLTALVKDGSDRSPGPYVPPEVAAPVGAVTE